MDSQNKESFWKQVFMRLHVTDDDRAIFPAGSVLPLDVTTARPLVGDEEVLVTKLLSEKFGKNVEIASRTVDPSVVGGIAVRYEDHIFDATVKRQLEKMDELMKTIHLREESLSGTDHLTDALKAGVEHFDNEVGLEEIGIVKTVGDGICTATGLGGAMSGELVSLHDGIYGMVQNLWPQEVGIVLLGGAQSGQGRGHGAPHREDYEHSRERGNAGSHHQSFGSAPGRAGQHQSFRLSSYRITDSWHCSATAC